MILALVTAAWAEEPAPVPAAEPDPAAEPAPVEPEPAPAAPEAVPAAEPAPEAAPAPVVEPVAAPAPVAEEPEPEPVVRDRPEAPPLRFEVSAELGSLQNQDPAYDWFGSGDGMPSYGFRVGYRVQERIAVLASWDLVRRGATVVVPSGLDGGSADFTSDDASLVAALVAHELRLGVKVDASLEDVLLPYLSAQGVLTPLWIRFDDDPSDPQSPGQVSATGVTGGVDLMAGAELRIPPGASYAFAWYLELGGGLRTTASLGDLGSMQPGGLAVRSGLGVRF